MGDVDKTIVVIVAIACIAMLEVWAIYNGLDGTLFSVVVGAITTIIGLCFGVLLERKKAVTDV